MSSNETRLPNSSLIYFKSLLVIVKTILRDRVKVEESYELKANKLSLKLILKIET